MQMFSFSTGYFRLLLGLITGTRETPGKSAQVKIVFGPENRFFKSYKRYAAEDRA